MADTGPSSCRWTSSEPGFTHSTGVAGSGAPGGSGSSRSVPVTCSLARSFGTASSGTGGNTRTSAAAAPTSAEASSPVAAALASGAGVPVPLTVIPGSAAALLHSAPRARRTTFRIRASCQSRIASAHSPSPADRSSARIDSTARAAVSSASVCPGRSAFSTRSTSVSTYSTSPSLTRRVCQPARSPDTSAIARGVPRRALRAAVKFGRYAAVSGSPRPRPQQRRREGGPDRDRHAERVRAPGPVRPDRRIPRGDHEEAAPAVGGRGADLVPQRLHQREVAAREQHHASGTSGPTPTANSARSTATSGAPGRPRTAGTMDQIAARDRVDQEQPRLSPAHRERVERGGRGRHGATAVPHDVPVLRRRRPAVLPAVPALGGHLPGRAVQHRVVRAAHPHGRAADRARGRRLRPHPRRRAPLPEPPRPGQAPAHPRAAAAADAASWPSGTRSTATRSPTSSWSGTTRTPGSRRPSRYDGHPDRGRRQQRGDRPRQRPALADPRGPAALQASSPSATPW